MPFCTLLKQVVNGVILPNDFPPYSTVWGFYCRANQSGLWDRIPLALVQKMFNLSKQAMPTYAIIDSQSVKIAFAAHDKGFDGVYFKNINIYQIVVCGCRF